MKQCSQDENENSAGSNSEISVGTNFIGGSAPLSIYSCDTET
jgi:hypothetical protein